LSVLLAESLNINPDKAALAKQFDMTDVVNPKEVDDIVRHLVEITDGGFVGKHIAFQASHMRCFAKMEVRVESDPLIAELLGEFKDASGGLLPLLHAIQSRIGYIPETNIPAIAATVNRSAAEIHGVVSFYHDLKSAPQGRHTLQICRAESCQATGGRELEQLARDVLGVEFGETTPDGTLTLEAVYCLGNCACSPSVRIDDATYARVDAARLQALIDDIRRSSV